MRETQRTLRAARIATTVVFLVTGAVFASWAARIPAVQDRLDLSPGELSIAILGIEAGAVLGLPLGGALATRIGSRVSFPSRLLLPRRGHDGGRVRAEPRASDGRAGAHRARQLG